MLRLPTKKNKKYPGFDSKEKTMYGNIEEEDKTKQNDQYEEALSLLSELRDVQSVPLFFRTARLCFSLNASVNHDSRSASSWKGKLDDLHSQLASAVMKFLEQFNQTKEQFGNACVSLLFVGAEACERLVRDKEMLMTQVSHEREKNVELTKSLESQLKDSALKENIELRTRLVMQQRNMMQHEIETRELVQRLQSTLAEKNALNLEKERLSEECRRSIEILERQTSAIAKLMDECDDNEKKKDQALNSLRKMNEDNDVLKLNLERHSKVIENLINVNADMIEATSCYAKMQDWEKSKDNVAGNLTKSHSTTVPSLVSPTTQNGSFKLESCFPVGKKIIFDMLEEKPYLSSKVSSKSSQLYIL